MDNIWTSKLHPDIEPSIDGLAVSVGSVTHSEIVMPFDVQCLLSSLAGPAGLAKRNEHQSSEYRGEIMLNCE